jgi:hypothetical protein
VVDKLQVAHFDHQIAPPFDLLASMLWPVDPPGTANRQGEENAGVGGIQHTCNLFRRGCQSVYVKAIRYDGKQRALRLLSAQQQVLQGRKEGQVVAEGTFAQLLP